MWTTVGLGVIPKDQKVIEKQYGNLIYFNFNVISKNPYKEGRKWIKISLLVPSDCVEEAREKIQPGKALLVRIGELGGDMLDSGYVAMTVNTKWKWIEPVKALPESGRKNYEDV